MYSVDYYLLIMVLVNGKVVFQIGLITVNQESKLRTDYIEVKKK